MTAEEIVEMIHEYAKDRICLDLSARAVITLSNHIKSLSAPRMREDIERGANFVFGIDDYET